MDIDGLVLWKAPTLPEFEIQATPEALKARTRLLARARLCPPVTDTATRQAAVDTMAELAALLNAAEKFRKEIKAPFFAAGKAIDAMEKDYTRSILAAHAKLNDQICDFETAEREKAAELVRLKSAQLEQFKQQLPPPQSASEAAQREDLILEKTAELGVGIIPAPQPAIGQRIVENWGYEILDLGLTWATYGARLVELHEKRAAIKELLNSAEVPRDVDGTPKIPGLRVKRVLINRIRAAKPTAAIDLEP